jgi:hypothetical protein
MPTTVAAIRLPLVAAAASATCRSVQPGWSAANDAWAQRDVEQADEAPARADLRGADGKRRVVRHAVRDSADGQLQRAREEQAGEHRVPQEHEAVRLRGDARREHRADRAARHAEDEEEAEAERASRPGQAVGELAGARGADRVEHADADHPRHVDGQERREVPRHPEAAQADGREQQPQRTEPSRVDPVAQPRRERLAEARAERADPEQQGRLLRAEPAADLEQPQQRRQERRVDVDGRVRDEQDADAGPQPGRRAVPGPASLGLGIGGGSGHSRLAIMRVTALLGTR